METITIVEESVNKGVGGRRSVLKYAQSLGYEGFANEEQAKNWLIESHRAQFAELERRRFEEQTPPVMRPWWKFW